MLTGQWYHHKYHPVHLHESKGSHEFYFFNTNFNAIKQLLIIIVINPFVLLGAGLLTGHTPPMQCRTSHVFRRVVNLIRCVHHDVFPSLKSYEKLSGTRFESTTSVWEAVGHIRLLRLPISNVSSQLAHGIIISSNTVERTHEWTNEQKLYFCTATPLIKTMLSDKWANICFK